MEEVPLMLMKMATSSGAITRAPLKTYSRRDSTNIGGPSNKRRRVETPSVVEELPPQKKFARSSIQSYFMTLSSSSSPAPVALASSDDAGSTPPSSPPSKASSTQLQRPTQRSKRRLNTRHSLPAATMMEGVVCTECRDLKCCCLLHESAALKAARTNLPEEAIKYKDGDQNNPAPLTNLIMRDTNGATHIVRVPKTATTAGHATNLTQTRINAGSAPSGSDTCNTCGMMYRNEQGQEKREHEAYHRRFVECSTHGLELWSAAVQKDQHRVGEEFLPLVYYIVDASSSSAARNWGGRVVNMMAREFSYAPDLDELYSKIPDPHNHFENPGRRAQMSRFKIGVAVLNKKPIAAVIIERIARAGAYTPAAATEDESNSRVEAISEINIRRCVFSVDRIWTHQAYRRQKWATRLLDVTREKFDPSMVVYKTEIAFSQPTKEGLGFATNYCRGDIFVNNSEKRID